MRSVENIEVSLPLGIVVERRKAASRWVDWIWAPVAVYLTGDTVTPWTELRREGETIRYAAGTLPLGLHRKDVEALRLNLMLEVPELYVVLEPDTAADAPAPWRPHLVTASSYLVQDLADTGEYLIEKVQMPDAVAAFIQAFVEAHPSEEAFKKRRRDRLDTEEQKFGKSPIFRPLTKQ